MNSLEAVSKFVYDKLSSLTSLPVYNGIAPITETSEHICFFIQEGVPIVYMNNIEAFEEFNVITHLWNKNSYDYSKSNIVKQLNNIQGYEIATSVYTQSCIYKGTQYLSSDIDLGWYGILNKFIVRIKNDSNSN